MNWCPNDGWEVSVMSIPSLDNSKYKVHKPRINIICLRSRGSPLKHKEEMEEWQKKSQERQAGLDGSCEAL